MFSRRALFCGNFHKKQKSKKQAPMSFSTLARNLDPVGRTTRRTYAQWGFGLGVVKILLDRIIAYLMGANYWGWFSYWDAVNASGGENAARSWEVFVTLLAVAVPFVVVGVLLTLRRLRDVGASPWLVLCFFVPAVNLVTFVILCLLPSRDVPPVEAPRGGPLGWLVRALALRSRAMSAVVAILFTLVLVVAMTALVTIVFRDYGWGVFVAMPFVLGLVATVLHGVAEPRTLRESMTVGLLALGFCGLAIIGVALEGLICLLMALPLAAPLVLLGALVGHRLQSTWWNRKEEAARIYVMGWIALPLAFLQESQMSPPARLLAATTTVEIAASPAEVWRQVIAFSELPPADELVFRAGIAYPQRATLTGHGVGAVRHCEFSTGPFVEPITVWDENERLAFDVIAQPHPMNELSPYRAIHPPHFDGFFHSERGEFRLTALPGGRTRLEGTTWYTQRLWPAAYWRLWSDYLLHTIHGRVLAHIRSEAESRVRGSE
jgi:uncharacterized membrane protein YhaH (DUF805 family)